MVFYYLVTGVTTGIRPYYYYYGIRRALIISNRDKTEVGWGSYCRQIILLYVMLLYRYYVCNNKV